MNLDIYLKFEDNCREAFEFYRDTFGGKFSEFQTFADGPPGMGVSEEYGHRMMHVALPIGPSTLMGCDSVPAFGPPTSAGNNFAVSVNADSREQLDDLFAKLSDGGAVTMPLQDMFWGGYFGALTDKFGVAWNLHFQAPGE